MKFSKLLLFILLSSLLTPSFAVTQKMVEAVNINKVDAVTLSKSVKGFGMKRSEAVVTYREEHGKFKTVDDLVKVRGIGKKFIERNREYLQKMIKFG